MSAADCSSGRVTGVTREQEAKAREAIRWALGAGLQLSGRVIAERAKIRRSAAAAVLAAWREERGQGQGDEDDDAAAAEGELVALDTYQLRAEVAEQLRAEALERVGAGEAPAAGVVPVCLEVGDVELAGRVARLLPRGRALVERLVALLEAQEARVLGEGGDLEQLEAAARPLSDDDVQVIEGLGLPRAWARAARG